MQVCLDEKIFYEGFFDSSFKFPNIAVTQPRAVEHYEIEIFTEYGGTAYINGTSRTIRPGLCICARPGDIRYSELPVRCHYVKLPEEMSDICALLEELPRFSRIRNADKCAGLIKDMLTAKIENNGLLRMARLLEIISVLREESLQYEKLHIIPQKAGRDGLQSAIMYMEEHFCEKCSLEKIACEAHFSPIYFHKMFKEAVGKTPSEYLLLLRINEAKRLLISENVNMAQVAELSGFSSQSYFNYVFKKHTSYTPAAYRRAHIEKYSV